MVGEGNVRFGRFAGVPLIWNFTVLFIPGSLFFHFSNIGIAARGALTLALTVAVILSILLHEAAHVWMARRYRVASEAIMIHGFGGFAFLLWHPHRRSEQVMISLAGPLANLALAAAGFLALVAVQTLYPAPATLRAATGLMVSGPVMTGLKAFVFLNLLLGIINLLPALPLDGGNIARTLLESRYPQRRAVQITAGLGVFVSLWLCMGVAAIGVGALVMGALLAFFNVSALRRPDEFIE
jgi:Zn-dependent protease